MREDRGAYENIAVRILYNNYMIGQSLTASTILPAYQIRYSKRVQNRAENISKTQTNEKTPPQSQSQSQSHIHITLRSRESRRSFAFQGSRIRRLIYCAFTLEVFSSLTVPERANLTGVSGEECRKKNKKDSRQQNSCISLGSFTACWIQGNLITLIQNMTQHLPDW